MCENVYRQAMQAWRQSGICQHTQAADTRARSFQLDTIRQWFIWMTICNRTITGTAYAVHMILISSCSFFHAWFNTSSKCAFHYQYPQFRSAIFLPDWLQLRTGPGFPSRIICGFARTSFKLTELFLHHSCSPSVPQVLVYFFWRPLGQPSPNGLLFQLDSFLHHQSPLVDS